jgi:hypothetical protein
MTKTGLQSHLSWTSLQPLPVPLQGLRWLLLVALFMRLVPAWADEKDDEYLRIYDILQQADALNDAGKFRPALAKYREADSALLTFKRNNRDWNPTSVSYRLNYLAVKIAETSDKITNPPPPGLTQTKGGSANSPQEVKLLDAGAEPRTQLRLHPKSGDKQVLQMSMQPTMEAKIGEMANPPVKMPAMKVILELTVKDISGDGITSYQIVFTDATVVAAPGGDPQMAEAIKSAMGTLKGLSGSGTVSNRGFNKGTEFKVPADSNPAMRQALEQMKDMFAHLAIPLPEEAIGAGAKWEARSKVKSQGVTLDQTATYELASLDGERAAIKSSIAQHAANQKVQNPMVPGMQADLTTMDATVKGDMSLLLTQVLPSSGTLSFHSEVNMSMNMGPQTQPIMMKADVAVSLNSK